MLKTVSVIFNERPKSWGLRGDPYLWDDLDKQIYCEKYSHGGMSSGYVSLEFWVEVAIPMLIERLEELAN